MGNQEKNLKKFEKKNLVQKKRVSAPIPTLKLDLGFGFRYQNMVLVVHYTSYRNTVMHGENITVECNHNYELEGNVTQITCNNGTFDRMPKCEPARCKTLPAPPKNGMVVVSFYSHFCILNSFGPIP